MQDLDDVIGKINSLLSNRTTQDSGESAEMFGQDDLEPLGLGTEKYFDMLCFSFTENLVGRDASPH